MIAVEKHKLNTDNVVKLCDQYKFAKFTIDYKITHIGTKTQHRRLTFSNQSMTQMKFKMFLHTY